MRGQRGEVSNGGLEAGLSVAVVCSQDMWGFRLCSAEEEYICGRKAEKCSLGLGGGGDMAAMCFSNWREEPDGIITAVYEIKRIRYSTKKECLD